MANAVSRPALIVLASGLRSARQRRSIKLRRLADMVDIHPSTLSAFELGQRIPEDTTVAHILGVLRAPNTVRNQLVDLARRARDRDLVTHDRSAEDLLLAAYEQRATHVFKWAPALIPEELQTAEYTHALRRKGLLNADTTTVRSLTRTVQQLTASKTSGPRYAFLIGEAATRPEVCSPEELRNQLNAVIAMSRHPRMSVRLVPAADCATGLLESFTLYEDRAGAFAVTMRHHQSAVFLTHENALTTYKKTAKSLESRAAEDAWP